MLGRRLTALIVDDDSLWSATLTEQFTDWGFVVETASSLATSSTLIDRGWTVVVLDLALPDGSGMTIAELLARLSTRPLTIAITGTATVEQAFKLAQLGVRGYLAKPVNARDLKETVRVLLEESVQESNPLEMLAGAEVGANSYQDVTDRVRRAMVEQALRLAGGNKTGAARILRVSRQAVQQLIRSLEVQDSSG